MEHRLPVKIYYEDTDCLGVVYHANYLKYFERGRSEIIGAQGKHISRYNDEGVLFAVFKMSVTFHKPARLGEQCEVVTRLVPATPYRVRMDQKLFRGDELLTEALVDVVCLDGDFQLREYPAELLEAAS